MKIALVSRGWFPSVRGGSEKFISKLSEELFKKGFEVIGITRWLPGHDRPQAPHQLIIFEDRNPKPFIASLRFSRWAAKVVNSLRPDIVIVNGYWGEASPLFISKSIPVIVIIHDVGLFKSEWAKKHRIKHFLRTLILKHIVARADKIVVPTNTVKQDIIQYLGADSQKIHVLGFEGVEGPFTRIHENNEWFDVVQVGRFAPNKGQLILLKAFKHFLKEVPTARLWLVGGRGVDPEHLKYLEEVKRLTNEINDAVGKEVVKVVVDAPSVDPYYRLADVCVAPSIGEEGYGLTVVECMSYGKPVITSSIFLETGVANEERAYIFPCGDVERLTELLLYVYKNYDEALRKAERGLEYAKQYSWKKVAEAFLKLINITLRSRN